MGTTTGGTQAPPGPAWGRQEGAGAAVAAAVKRWQWDEVAAALDAGFPVNACLPGIDASPTLLHVAAWRNHGPTLSRLLSAGADVDARNLCGQTPTFYAAMGGAPEALAVGAVGATAEGPPPLHLNSR
jgi:hypothetical protein